RAMNVRSRSWSLQARSHGAAGAAFAIVLFFASWTLLHQGWFMRGQIIDTPVYQHYGDAMARGDVPYRDFSVEYPPGALPAFVLLTLAYVWRTRGRRQALTCLGVLAGAVAAIVLPFAALAPGGVWHSVVRQATRPLQVESLGAALLVASHHLFGTGITMVSSHGSQNLGGSAADTIGAAQSVLQVIALLGIWIAFA